VLHRGKEVVPVDDAFLAIEAVHSLIEFNEGMCEVSLLPLPSPLPAPGHDGFSDTSTNECSRV